NLTSPEQLFWVVPATLPCVSCRKTPTLCQPPWKDLVWPPPGCLSNMIQKTCETVLYTPKALKPSVYPAFCFCLAVCSRSRFLPRSGFLVAHSSHSFIVCQPIFSSLSRGHPLRRLNPEPRISMRRRLQ